MFGGGEDALFSGKADPDKEARHGMISGFHQLATAMMFADYCSRQEQPFEIMDSVISVWRKKIEEERDAELEKLKKMTEEAPFVVNMMGGVADIEEELKGIYDRNLDQVSSELMEAMRAGISAMVEARKEGE